MDDNHGNREVDVDTWVATQEVELWVVAFLVVGHVQVEVSQHMVVAVVIVWVDQVEIP